MVNQEILNEYREYLLKEDYAEKTVINYTSQLKRYMEINNIDTLSHLEVQLSEEPERISQLQQVYKWRKRYCPPTRHKRITQIPVYNDELIEQFQKERNIKNSTMQGYTSSLQMYLAVCGFNDTHEMIKEALEDEKKGIPTKEARINEHLRKYKAYLQDAPNIHTNHTRHTYFTKIETFYRHFQVTVPTRPALTMKSEYHVGYYDLPNKEMIQTAINQSDILMASMIYFMSSSGTAKTETLNITVGDFIDGLRDYTNETKPEKVLKELKERRDLVPVIHCIRQKTNIGYYTCCSPEATYHIIQYLLTCKNFGRDNPVWQVNGSYVMKKFQQINDRNGWGKIGPYRRFRTHTLRKFHASNIGCSFDVINMLEGRTNGTIHETYVKTRPEKLKEIYMEHMHNVMINTGDYIGPHLGGESEEEKLKNSIVDLVPDLVPTLEKVTEIQEQAQVVQPQVLPQAPFDYNILKDIARLETRLDAIEKRLQKLEQ